MDNPPHYLMQSKSDRAKVYEYYSDIMSYPKRYPGVYGIINVVNKPSDDSLDVEILAPLEKPSENDPFITRFTFIPQDEIRYEVINGYGKGEIKNSIIIKEPSDHAIRLGCKCEVEVNHLPLDIMKLDPQLLEESNPSHMTYLRTVSNLVQQDHIHLEGKRNLDEVRDCPDCGGVKSVRPIKSETNGNKKTKTIWLECSECGKTSTDISIETSNGVDLNG